MKFHEVSVEAAELHRQILTEIAEQFGLACELASEQSSVQSHNSWDGFHRWWGRDINVIVQIWSGVFYLYMTSSLGLVIRHELLPGRAKDRYLWESVESGDMNSMFKCSLADPGFFEMLEEKLNMSDA